MTDDVNDDALVEQDQGVGRWLMRKKGRGVAKDLGEGRQGIGEANCGKGKAQDPQIMAPSFSPCEMRIEERDLLLFRKLQVAGKEPNFRAIKVGSRCSPGRPKG